MHKKVIVIGSGPAAAACVKILLKRKIKPLVIDIGSTKSKSNKEIFKKIPSKTLKNFCFSTFDSIVNFEKLGFLKSVGFGGFSNVWGGSISKIGINEMKDWPISFSALNKYYNFVDSFFNHFGNFDLYSKKFNLPKPNIERKNILDLNIIKPFVSGSSRIALSKKNKQPFSTYEYFSYLIDKKKITYMGNIEVNKLVEKNGIIYVYDSNKLVATSNRLFLGAGAFNSSIIVLNSIPKLKDITFKESKLIVSLWNSKTNVNKIVNNKFSDHFISSIKFPFIHNQIYLFKKDIIDAIKSDYFILSNIFGKLLRILSKKYFLVFTYLTDDVSDSILISNGSIKNIKLKKSKKHNFMFRYFVKKITLMNNNQITYTGIKFTTKFGSSYHYGSSFPMSKKSSLKKTDIKGRLKCFNNIHIIDGSILPSIPTTTITYTIMANAARVTDLSLNK